MKKKLFRQTAIPVLTAACVFSQVGMAFSAIPSSNTGYAAQAYTQGTWKHRDGNITMQTRNQVPVGSTKSPDGTISIRLQDS